VISRPKHVENTYKWNIYLSCCIKLVFFNYHCMEPRNWNLYNICFDFRDKFCL